MIEVKRYVAINTTSSSASASSSSSSSSSCGDCVSQDDFDSFKDTVDKQIYLTNEEVSKLSDGQEEIVDEQKNLESEIYDIKDQIKGLEAGQKGFSLYSDAEAAGLSLNDIAQVYADSGTHIDPVSGETVDNNGTYIKVDAGLKRVSDNSLDSKADKTDLDMRAGSYFDVNGDPLEVFKDSNGNVCYQLTKEGHVELIKLKIGGLSIARDGDSSSKIEGKFNYGDYISEYNATVSGHDDWLEVDVDSKFRVGRILYADGTVVYPGDSSANVPNLIEMISLPDGAQGQNESGGFTITGINKITTGKYIRCWVVGNDGRASESISKNLCSIIILSPDMRKIVKEFPMDTVLPKAGSIQGVAWDTSDDTIWFADQGSNIIQHIDLTGKLLTDSINPGYIPNGLAYISESDELIAPEYTTTTVNIFSCVDGSKVSTVNGINKSHDQLYYDADTKYLWYTVGDNGKDGYAQVMDLSSGASIASYEMIGSQSIEGIYRDGKNTYIANDGGYHVAANPPLSVICKYELETN